MTIFLSTILGARPRVEMALKVMSTLQPGIVPLLYLQVGLTPDNKPVLPWRR